MTTRWLSRGIQVDQVNQERHSGREHSGREWRFEGRTEARPNGNKGGCSLDCSAECQRYVEIHLSTLASRSHLKNLRFVS